ncbi:hypothetical protein [Neptunomonas concharum]|nr:hypothetical protein [Neptunomonas concharum]
MSTLPHPDDAGITETTSTPLCYGPRSDECWLRIAKPADLLRLKLGSA